MSSNVSSQSTPPSQPGFNLPAVLLWSALILAGWFLVYGINSGGDRSRGNSSQQRTSTAQGGGTGVSAGAIKPPPFDWNELKRITPEKLSSGRPLQPTYISTSSAEKLSPARPTYTPSKSWTPSRVAENGSYYGQPNRYGVPKTVHVRGYTRKDGTYVRSHYRSSPSSSRRR